MAWFHTWFGLFVGFLLFAVFWMGTLTVFDKEFDRWMHPESRSIAGECCILSPNQLETVLLKAHELAPGSDNIRLRLPTERTPMTLIRIVEPDRTLKTYFIDPDTGKVVSNEHTLGGSGFFFPSTTNSILPGITWGIFAGHCRLGHDGAVDQRHCHSPKTAG